MFEKDAGEEILDDSQAVLTGEPGAGEQEEGAEAAAAAAAAKPAVVVDPAEFKRVRADLRAERTARRESDETARYWAEQARSAPAKPEAAAPADDFSDVDLVEAITANGVAGLDGVLKRLGYTKRDELLEQVATATRKSSSETQLMREYPELENTESPLFKATAVIYNSLKADPEFKGAGQRLIAIAARTAKAEMALTNDGGRGRQRAGSRSDDHFDDDDPDEFPDEQTPEEARAARADRQAGDRGRRDSRGGGDETLNEDQRRMVENFRRAGADLTEETYRKHAKAGVRMGGVPTRRSEAPRQQPQRRAA